MSDLTQEDLAFGKICYEAFAEQRMAVGYVLPPWTDGPNAGGLPDSEKEIWALVARAAREHVTFVITDDVRNAASGSDAYFTTGKIRAAALAAGFRVEER